MAILENDNGEVGRQVEIAGEMSEKMEEMKAGDAFFNLRLCLRVVKRSGPV